MIEARDLNRLLRAAVRDRRNEPEFFRALLDATVFVHESTEAAPAARRRFVLLKSPDDGQYVLPVFTDRAKAEVAARRNVRVVALPGRELLQLTLGTPLMINPNDTRTTLYPQKIRRLLLEGAVAVTYEHQVGGDDNRRFYRLGSKPRRLIQKLCCAEFVYIPKLLVAYAVGVSAATAGQPDSILVAVGGEDAVEIQMVRAVAAALDGPTRKLRHPIDISYFDAGEFAPNWLRELRVPPIYRRRAVLRDLDHRLN